MKYPCLVLPQFCKTEAEVLIYSEELSEEGELEEKFHKHIKCNFQSKAYRVLDEHKSLITLSGKALFPGDLCPGVKEISSGAVKIDGVEYVLHKGSKVRNPDGTVNYTELELK